MKINIIGIFIFVSFSAFSQFVDDFSDGNFTNNPHWSGDTIQFEVNNSKQLHLLSSGADISSIYTNNVFNTIDNFQWEFWVKLSFNSSANNNARVYILSDRADLENSLNGYFVQIGESNDSLALFKQIGNNIYKIIAGTVSFTGNSTNQIRIKVTRDDSANWKLFSDVTGGNDFQIEGAANDKTFTTGNFFGIFCKYTSSNSTKFYFDNFVVGQIPIDSFPPYVKLIQILNSNEIKLEFNEMLTSLSAENINNYFIYEGIGIPQLATIQTGNKQIILKLANDLIINTEYKLYVSNIEDIVGNKISSDTIEFRYSVLAKGDIVINEFFPDPTPTIGLPEVEFIELFNTTQFPIHLQNWSIADNSKTVSIPDYIIPSKGFLILTKETVLFSSYGLVNEVPSLPGLNNAGDDIILKDSNGQIIDRLSYTDEWYKDDNKDNGGWTLERINPYHPCSDQNNWMASLDIQGGTPGTQNSTFSNIADSLSPEIVDIQFEEDTILRINFNENIDTTNIDHDDFHLMCPNSVREIKFYPDNLKIIEIILQTPLNHLDTCTLNFKNVKDCWGNKNSYWQSYFLKYIVPDKANMYDVVISEILPKPYPNIKLPEGEFIELHNRSNKYISLKKWTVSDRTSISEISDFTLAPDSFLIICPENFAPKYKDFGTTIGLHSFPSLNDSEDEIVLKDSFKNLIYHLNYEKSWYKNELKEQGGWSLEMIDPDNVCGGEENWIASTDKNGGTPGKINSLDGYNPDIEAPEISRLYVSDASHIFVYFNEKMDSLTLINNMNYNIIPDIGQPATIRIEIPYYNFVLLTLPINLDDDMTYILQVNNLRDCFGNKIQDNTQMKFALPDPVDSMDIVINEVLFNPQPSGYDFVELFNKSDKVVELKNLKIATYDDNMNIKQPENISILGYQLFPDDFVVITENSIDIQNRYTVKFPKKIIEVNSLPSFNDDEGHVVIIKSTGEIIDHFHYLEDYHFDLLDNNEGVSLERMNPKHPSNKSANWHSAASSYGYATPSYQNSQYSDIDPSAKEVVLSPEVFSPDEDGYNDVLLIQYNFTKTENFGSISIYDINGRLINKLVSNELFGQTGFYSWDGTEENGSIAAVGVYIVFIEISNLDGTTKKYKKTCTLARKR